MEANQILQHILTQTLIGKTVGVTREQLRGAGIPIRFDPFEYRDAFEKNVLAWCEDNNLQMWFDPRNAEFLFAKRQ